MKNWRQFVNSQTLSDRISEREESETKAASFEEQITPKDRYPWIIFRAKLGCCIHCPSNTFTYGRSFGENSFSCNCQSYSVRLPVCSNISTGRINVAYRVACKVCLFNKLTSIFHGSVRLLIMNFVITLSKWLWIRRLLWQCYDEIHCL